MRAISLATLTSFAVACQTYDFEPADPIAWALTSTRETKYGRTVPNLMLLVDKSGSMDQPIELGAPACQTRAGTCGAKSNLCDPRVCPTRWSELQGALSAFVGSSGGVGRFGLATFPSDVRCGAPDQVRIELPRGDAEAELLGKAEEIQREILRIQSEGLPGPFTTGGGTPTGAALSMLGQHEPLLGSARRDFVLLLTDGLPNCNEANPNDYAVDRTSCRCTLPGGVCEAPNNRIGCLDVVGTLEAIRALRQREIETIVVGFGAEAQGSDAQTVLAQMAAEGGFRAKVRLGRRLRRRLLLRPSVRTLPAQALRPPHSNRAGRGPGGDWSQRPRRLRGEGGRGARDGLGAGGR